MSNRTNLFKINPKNAIIHIIDCSCFQIGMSLCSYNVIIPAFIKNINNNPYLISLIFIISDLGSTLPQLISIYNLKKKISKNNLIKVENSIIKKYFIMEFIHRFTFIIIGIGILIFGKFNNLFLIIFYLLFILSSITWGLAIPYWIDTVSMTIPDNVRVEFLGQKDFIAQIIGIISSFFIPLILGLSFFPFNYGILFIISGIFFTIGTLPIVFFDKLVDLNIKNSENRSINFFIFLFDGIKKLFKNNKRNLFILLLLSVVILSRAFFIPYIIDNIITPYYNDKKEIIVSSLNTFLLISLAISSWITGKLISILGIKKSLILFLLSFILCNILIIFFQNLIIVYLCEFLLAISMAGFYYTQFNYILDNSSRHDRSMAVAIFFIMNSIFSTIFNNIGGTIAFLSGYKILLIFSTLMGIILLILVINFLNPKLGNIFDKI